MLLTHDAILTLNGSIYKLRECICVCSGINMGYMLILFNRSGWPLILEKLENTWEKKNWYLIILENFKFQPFSSIILEKALRYTWIYWDFFHWSYIFITLSINFLNWLILLMDEICISIRMHFYALYLCIFIICPVWCHYSRSDLSSLT